MAIAKITVTYQGLDEALIRCLEAFVHAASCFDYAMRVTDEVTRNQRIMGLQQIFQDAVNQTQETVDQRSKYIADIGYPASIQEQV